MEKTYTQSEYDAMVDEYEAKIANLNEKIDDLNSEVTDNFDKMQSNQDDKDNMVSLFDDTADEIRSVLSKAMDSFKVHQK